MAIEQTDIQKIRSEADIAAIIGEHTALKRVGRQMVGLCPFHSESTPSFTVNAELGVYHCFGCQASGDVINFVCEIEGISFVEAISRLAARLNIEISTESDTSYHKRSKWKDLASVMSVAVEFYHEQLMQADAARMARRYLRQRGYDSAIVRQFKLGYAPADSTRLSLLLMEKAELAVEAGLISYSTYQNNYVDIFKDRVIFPIFDSGNTPIAIGGRILPEEFRTITAQVGPKYRNTKESILYSKRKTLYGLNLAKKEMSHEGVAIVCEGYTDVIAFHNTGKSMAVATCGTALTEYHIKTLSNFAKKIILAFDADLAGQEAMARLYDWEEKHDISLMVAKLPTGSDPAELALSDPNLLRQAIDNAQPYLGFLVDRYTANVSGLHPEERAKAAQKSLLAIASHPNSLVREEYLAKTADLTRLSIADLRAQLQTIIEKPYRSEVPTDRKRQAAEGSHYTPHRQNFVRESDSQGSIAQKREDRQSGKDRGKNPYGNIQKVNQTSSLSVSKSDESSHSQKKNPLSKGRASSRGPIAGEVALLLAIHQPESIAHKLAAPLFTDELQQRAFIALTKALSFMDATQNSEEDVSRYLYQLSVKRIPEGTSADDIISSLCILSVEKKIDSLLLEVRLAKSTESLNHTSEKIGFAKHALEIIKAAQTNGVHTRDSVDAREALVSWLSDGVLPNYGI